ncbi:phosphotyrosine protein phosphatase [Neolewinella aurantiaca]|uniref:Phosphotyrosine protein phosphatase n=2 Tax=Neolewinella aurantiaca TaxID=2602767 RepID=A0A5C7FI04_9BACT|nr:phosphotyrosine protein phosphatase [Neolewinella aurantiaca]
MQNLLFICSRNQWRSLTAETIFRKRDDISVRSAGTVAKARVRVNGGLLRWADVVFVMEKKHHHYLLSRFPGETKYLNIEVLDIPDEYKYMDEDLIGELEDVVADWLREQE